MKITGRQIRMARAYLHWTVDDLAGETGLQWARIQQLEKLDSFEKSHLEKINTIKQVLEKKGIEFIDENHTHHGTIRIKKKL